MPIYIDFSGLDIGQAIAIMFVVIGICGFAYSAYMLWRDNHDA